MMAGGLTGAAAAAVMLVGMTAPAHAAYTTYVSVQTPSGSSGPKVLDIKDYSLADRGQAQLWALRASGEVRNQRWTISQVGTLNGHAVLRLQNALSGRCLDKSQDVPDTDGNAVYQYGCSGTSNQQWERLGSSGWVQLRNVSDGRCLDVNGPSFTDGAILHVWHCYSNWSQRWNTDQ